MGELEDKKELPQGMDDDLGRVAYTTYSERRGWKSFKGDQLPAWDEVRLDIKLAWIAAAVSAVEHWRIYGTPMK